MNQKLIFGTIALVSIVSTVCMAVYSNRTEVGWVGAVEFANLTSVQKSGLVTYFERSVNTTHYAIFILGLVGLLVGGVALSS